MGLVMILFSLIILVLVKGQDYELVYKQNLISSICSNNFDNSGNGSLPSIFDSQQNTYVNSGCIINCYNNPNLVFKVALLKSGQVYQKSVSVPKPHYQVIISGILIAIDGYNLSASNLSVKINNISQTGALTLTSTTATNYCKDNSNDNIYFYQLVLPHTDLINPLNIQIMVIQSNGSSYELGIKGLDVIYGKCSEGCQSCSDSLTCSSCKAKADMKLGEKCISQCTSSQYKSVSTCSSCSASCSTCFGPNSDNCTSCSSGYFLNSNFQCVLGCSSSSNIRNDLFGTCITYNSSTSKCSSKDSLNKCTSCNSPYYLSNTNCAQSQSDCPAGYYFRSSTNSCVTIPTSNCTIYDETKGRCLVCISGYFVKETNYLCDKPFQINIYQIIPVNKPSDFYQDSLSGYYVQCDSSCLTCTGPSQYECSSCLSGKQLYANQCIQSCNYNNGYYLDESTQTCKSCNSYCQSCYGPTSSECIACSSGKYMMGSSNCIDSCPNNYYPDSSNVCQLCLSNCDICINGSTCTTCKSGFNLYQNNQCLQTCPPYYYPDNTNKCQQCLSNCLTCSDNSSCTLCTSGFYLYNTSSCLNICPTKFFKNDQNQSCSPCLDKCETCNDSTSCSACSLDNGVQYYLHQNKQCVNPCPATYANDVNNNCKQANCTDPNCTSCDQTNTSICQICAVGYYLQPAGQPNSGTCQTTCPPSYYKDNETCQVCLQNCQDCNDSITCNTCQTSFISLMKNSQIIACIDKSQCTTQQFLDLANSQCRDCLVDQCMQCSTSDSVCDNCLNNLYLFQNTCVASCLDGYYADQINSIKQCISCNQQMPNCYQCQTNSICDLSQVGYYKLNQNTCVQTCPDGYTGDVITRSCQKIAIPYCIRYTLDQCSQCATTIYTLDNNQCFLDCPQYQNPNYSNGSCDPIQCPQKLFFYKYQCIETCPSNTVPNSLDNLCNDIEQKTFQISQIPDKNEFMLNFDNKFFVDLNSVKLFIKLDFSASINYSYSIESVSGQSFKIIITLKFNPPQNIQMTTSFVGIKSLDGNKGIELYPNEQTIPVELTFPVSEAQKAVTQAIADTTKSVSQSVVVGSFSLVFTSQFQLLSTLVELTEIYYLMIFIDILKPLNLQDFLISFQDISMQFIANIFEKIHGEFEFQNSYPTFQQNNYSSFYLNSAGSLYTMILAIIVIHLMLLGIKKLLVIRGQSNKIVQLTDFLINTIKKQTYFELLYITYLQFTFSAIINMVNLQDRTEIQKLNLGFLFLNITILTPIPFLLYFLYKKNIYFDIVKGFKGHNQKYPEYMLLLYARKIVFCLAIICAYGYPYAQVVIVSLPNICLIIYLVKYQPFTTKINNFKNIYLEILFFTSVILFMFLINSDQFNEEQRTKIAWFIIGTFVVIILSEVVTLLVNIIYQIKQLVIYVKNLRQSKSKVVPASTIEDDITPTQLQNNNYSNQNPKSVIQNKQLTINLEETSKLKSDSQSVISIEQQSVSPERRVKRKRPFSSFFKDTSFITIASAQTINSPKISRKENYTKAKTKSKFLAQFIQNGKSQSERNIFIPTLEDQ